MKKNNAGQLNVWAFRTIDRIIFIGQYSFRDVKNFDRENWKTNRTRKEKNRLEKKSISDDCFMFVQIQILPSNQNIFRDFEKKLIFLTVLKKTWTECNFNNVGDFFPSKKNKRNEISFLSRQKSNRDLSWRIYFVK